MATIKSVNISGHYVVSINAVPFHTCILNSKNVEVGQNRILYSF